MFSTRICPRVSVRAAGLVASRPLAGAVQQQRGMLKFLKQTIGLDDSGNENDPTPENRFHLWDQSPNQDIRERAAVIRARSKCPVTGEDVRYVCPKSGIPTHHSREAYESDATFQEQNKAEKLFMANIYEHDLRSGREFPEFDLPATQDKDDTVNFMNWDLFLYTRDFYSMDTEFQMAAVTKMLSYPITIGSVLHTMSPYALKPNGPLTLEGLKSLAALRYSLFPIDKSRALNDRPIRLFILGARAESQLPPHVWKQLSYLIPTAKWELYFIGPEAYYDRDKHQYVQHSRPVEMKIDDTMTFKFYSDYFHVLHEAHDFFPYDPYLDAFFLFHPGLGAPEAMDQWAKSLPGLLESKCAIFSTGFHKDDLERDWTWLMDKFGSKLDVLLEPSENIFGSTKWELNDLNSTEVYQFNQQMFAFRGKRYHAIPQ